jgi:hypothetical protein
MNMDQGYFQIWGNSLQIHSYFTEKADGKSEPFSGYVDALLISSQEPTQNTSYNFSGVVTSTFRNLNGSEVSCNTSISMIMTPIKRVVTHGDIVYFNLTIISEEDLLMKVYPFIYKSGTDFMSLSKGENHFSFELKVLPGRESYDVILYRSMTTEKQFLNSSEYGMYGYEYAFALNLYKNVTDYNKKYVFLNYFEEDILILPFSGHVEHEEKIEIEKGLLVVSFPLNVVFSADKIIFVRSSGWGCFVNSIDPAAIYLSPPITLSLMIASISVYTLYRKWLSLILHLLKYKIFYSFLSIAIVLFLNSTAVLGSEYATTTTMFSFCLAIVGLISIGTVKNNFTKCENRLFWKVIGFTMLLESTILLSVYLYQTAFLGIEPFSLQVYLIIFLIPCLIFLGCCFIGMLMNTSLSILAGFSLLLGHAVLRIWNRVKSKHESPPISLAPDLKNKPEIPRYLVYCISQLFMVSVWYVILISSSAPLPIDKIWSTLWDTGALFILIPLQGFVFLLFIFERLNTSLQNKIVGPRLFWKLWSTFAAAVFIAKILWQGLNSEVLFSIGYMFYFLLLASSGFAAGFVGTYEIGLKHALDMIEKVSKVYRDVQLKT